MAHVKSKKARVKGLSFSDIAELGGEKADLELIGDIEDNSESDLENDGITGKDFDEEPIKKAEIKDFLAKLEIFKYRPKDDEQDTEDETEIEKGETEQEETKKGKKDKKKDKKEKGKAKEKEKERVKQKEKEEVKQKEKEKEKTTDDEADKNKETTAAPESRVKKKKSKNKYKKDLEEDVTNFLADHKSEKNKQVQHDEISSTTPDPAVAGHKKNPVPALKSHMAGYRPRSYLLVKKGGDWRDTEDKKPSDGQLLSNTMTRQIEEFAAKLLQDEINVYKKQKENTKRSDVGWMKTVLTSGTLADKMGALMVLVQESPLHNLAHLDTLIGMAKKKGKRECLQACDTLRELFLSELLPEDRKLRTFKQRPLLELGNSCGWNKDSLDKRLLLWYFEEKLKEKYEEFIKALQTMSHDTVVATKQKAVNTMYHLLVNKPEQEKSLLTLLINKVGDPHYKLASSVSYLLMKIVESHPNMKGVLVREVEELLFRPNISTRAQYYSVCFLTQLILSHEEQELAFKLVTIYFSFFKRYVKQGEVDSKMMSALLSGVNRAFPYAKLRAEFLHEHLDPLYKIVHVVNFNTSIQALTLLYQVVDSGQSAADRYYTALYRKLIDPALTTSSKQALYLNLLFKSLKKDESDKRIKAFIKRLLQVCSYQTPQFICGALVLLSEVIKQKPGLLSLSHVEEDSDEEEHFVDAPDEDADETKESTAEQDMEEDVDNVEKQDTAPSKKSGSSSWVHRSQLHNKCNVDSYDPMLRYPQYCHAEAESVWELESLTQHYHPSVSLFAAQILMGEHIVYGGNPLEDFTLISFLDRFVYKNPKKSEQIAAKVQTISKKKYEPVGVKSMSAASDQFQKLDEANVPVDDIYLHRYFNQKAARANKRKGDDADSDAESVDDNEFEAYLDKFEGNVDAHEVGDLNIDFSSEYGKKKGSQDLIDSDSDEDDDGDDDEEVVFDEKTLAQLRAAMGSDDEEEEEMEEGDNDNTFDEEDVEFSDDEDEFEEAEKPAKRKKQGKRDRPSKKKKTENNLHAASEEFGSVIDENVGSKIDTTGSEAMMVKDKADAKQIQWEVKRDKWMKGKDWKSKKKGPNRKPRFKKGMKGKR